MISAELSPRKLVAGQETELAVLFANTGSGTCSNLIFRLELPRQIFSVDGVDRLEIGSLPAGETVTRTVRVRPVEPGTCLVTSRNFSYRDRHGTSRRIEGFQAELVVQPRAQVVFAEPELVLSLQTTHLPHQSRQALRGRIENVGGSSVHDTTVSISGQLDLDARGRRQHLSSIDPGQSIEFSCHVRADDRGDIPVYLDVSFTDETGRPRRVERMSTVSVDGGGHTPTPGAQVRILYLAASPSDQDRTRWEEGFHEIADACRRSKNASSFELMSRFAIRDRDIGQALFDLSPNIVQFSGHGLEGGLYVESALGYRQPVAADGLVQLFGAAGESVDCVVLGACHSMSLARDLARHIDYAIGMDGEIDSRSMINFSIGLYQALGAGRSVDKAFDTGLATIAMQPYKSTDQLVPRLFRKGQSGA